MFERNLSFMLAAMGSMITASNGRRLFLSNRMQINTMVYNYFDILQKKALFILILRTFRL